MKITPEKLFEVIKETVMTLGPGDLMSLMISKPKTYADLSPSMRAAFEKAAGELSKPR